MTRKTLKKMDGERLKFYGTFERFGTKNGYMGIQKTVLLVDVKLAETDQIVTQHLWFNLTKGFEKLDLQIGDKVEFHARVKEYTKGYVGRRLEVYKPIETDYKLSHPTKLKKL